MANGGSSSSTSPAPARRSTACIWIWAPPRPNLERHADVQQCHPWSAASFEIDPGDAGLIELRMRVLRGDKRSARPGCTGGPRREFRRRIGASSLSGGMPPDTPLAMPPRTALQALASQPRTHGRRGPIRALHSLCHDVRRVDLRHLSNAASRALREHDLPARADDLLLRRLAGLDCVCRGSVLAGASKRRDAVPPAAAGDASLTALVMPIYNEDPVRTTSALQAMAEALGGIGAERRFEIVVLSDSTNADAWVRETAAIDLLRRSLSSVMPVWYRRRWKNVARKSGNVEDFVTRWAAATTT